MPPLIGSFRATPDAVLARSEAAGDKRRSTKRRFDRRGGRVLPGNMCETSGIPPGMQRREGGAMKEIQPQIDQGPNGRSEMGDDRNICAWR